MIGLLQRVSTASVTVDGVVAGAIERGVLVLVGVQRGDGDAQATRLAERILTYRVFPDEAGRMNRSVADIGGGVLLVPQFTLAADTTRGTRASFSSAAAPEEGRRLFDRLAEGRGDRTAVLFGDQRHTYADVAERVVALRGFLAHRRMMREERILIVLHDSPAFVWAFFAALHHGAVVTMGNPEAPAADPVQVVAAELRAFLDSVETRRPPEADLRSGAVPPARVLDAARRSAREGRMVAVESEDGEA